ncbi:hypothetical protein D3C86_1857210 [compost metagenome]
MNIRFYHDATAQLSDPVDSGGGCAGWHNNGDVSAKDFRSLGDRNTKITAAHRNKPVIFKLIRQFQKFVKHPSGFKRAAKLGVFQLQEDGPQDLFSQFRTGNGRRANHFPR